MPRQGDGRFLQHLIRLCIGQAGAPGKIANQLAIDAIKLLPAQMVITSFEPIEKARPGLDRTPFALWHTVHHTT
jgi:hypothetical protein